MICSFEYFFHKGYGARYITNNCKIGVAILMAQCGCSVILQSLMGG